MRPSWMKRPIASASRALSPPLVAAPFGSFVDLLCARIADMLLVCTKLLNLITRTMNLIVRGPVRAPAQAPISLTTIGKNCRLRFPQLWSREILPLDRRWLKRAKSSHSAEPLGGPVYRQAPLSPETWERLRQHPQFREFADRKSVV